MLLRLYDDDSPLIGLSKDNTEQVAKGSAPDMKDGPDKAEDDQTLNDNGASGCRDGPMVEIDGQQDVSELDP